MAIAIHLRDYLASHDVAYDVVSHPRAASMLAAAKKAMVPSGQVAKAVLLEDGDGYLLAVIPASHHLELARLRGWLERPLELATELDLPNLFDDCELGAIPPIGAAYGIDTIVDDSVAEQADIYLEAGDHRSLIHMSRDVFARLMAGARHGRFSAQD